MIPLLVAVDGRVWSGDEQGQVLAWSRDGVELRAADVPLPPQDRRFYGVSPETVVALAVSGDGRTVAAAFEAGVAAVFDARTGALGPVVTFDTTPSELEASRRTVFDVAAVSEDIFTCGTGARRSAPLALSADGRRLLTTGYALRAPAPRNVVREWDTRDGALRGTWTFDEGVSAVGYDRAGEGVVHAGGELVVLSSPPRFVAHGVESAQLDPVSGAAVVQRSGASWWVDPVDGRTVPLTGEGPVVAFTEAGPVFAGDARLGFPDADPSGRTVLRDGSAMVRWGDAAPIFVAVPRSSGPPGTPRDEP